MESLIYIFGGFIAFMLMLGLFDVLTAIDLDKNNFPTKKKDRER